MAWKQPIDTELDKLTKGNLFAATVLMELIRRASNSERAVYFNDICIHLNKGECICGRYELAARFGLKRREAGRVQRALVKLEKRYNAIHRRKSKDCSIVTVLNYDVLTDIKQSDDPSEDKR
jgi:hypothetical protein